MIVDRDLVLAAAATYAGGVPTFSGVGGAVRAYRTMVDDVAVYAIEGTHDTAGWMIDAAALPLPSQLIGSEPGHVLCAIKFLGLPVLEHDSVDHPDIGFVHGGIYAALMSIWPAMWETMRRDDKVALTGHSLGAGCAVLATALMVALGKPPICAAFFAPPRVGFKKVHRLVDQVPTAAYRNGNDPVTDVPFRARPLWLYEQRPLLRGGDACRPPWDAHHIDRYVALEEMLRAANPGEPA